MEITQRVEGDVIVFLPEARVDTQAAADLDQALQAAVSAGQHKLVVDMSGVEYISSAGLRALAARSSAPTPWNTKRSPNLPSALPITGSWQTRAPACSLQCSTGSSTHRRES